MKYIKQIVIIFCFTFLQNCIQNEREKYLEESEELLFSDISDEVNILIAKQQEEQRIQNIIENVSYKRNSPTERYELWSSLLPKNFSYSHELDLSPYAENFELSGLAIASVLKAASVESQKRGDTIINFLDLNKSIRLEMIRKSISY